MNDGYSGKKWEVTLSPEALIHVHYETASPKVINDGFKGLAAGWTFQKCIAKKDLQLLGPIF